MVVLGMYCGRSQMPATQGHDALMNLSNAPLWIHSQDPKKVETLDYTEADYNQFTLKASNTAGCTVHFKSWRIAHKSLALDNSHSLVLGAASDGLTFTNVKFIGTCDVTLILCCLEIQC